MICSYWDVGVVLEALAVTAAAVFGLTLLAVFGRFDLTKRGHILSMVAMVVFMVRWLPGRLPACLPAWLPGMQLVPGCCDVAWVGWLAAGTPLGGGDGGDRHPSTLLPITTPPRPAPPQVVLVTVIVGFFYVNK